MVKVPGNNRKGTKPNDRKTEHGPNLKEESNSDNSKGDNPSLGRVGFSAVKPLICVDLTPYYRGPITGVGLVGFHTFRALKEEVKDESDFALLGVARGRAFSNQKPFFPTYLSPWRRLSGWNRSLYYGFEVKTPPAFRSLKVLQVPDVWSLTPNPYQHPDFQVRQGKKLRKAIPEAHAIIVSALTVKNQILDFFPKLNTPISVIPHGPSVIANSTSPGNPQIAQYLQKKRPYLLSVATFEKRKNLDLLFQAFLQEKRLPVDLVTLGRPGFGGETALELLKKVRSSGVGGIDLESASEGDLQTLYENALGIVLLSKDEGFGFPALDALSFSKPVLLSKIPALQEIAGPLALYACPNSAEPEEIRLKILELINQSNDRIHKDHLLKRSQQFSWQNVAQQTLKVFSQCFENHP